MADAADHRESLERAYETLRRVDDAERQRRLEEQLRGPVDDAEPVANWRGCTTTAAMTTSQFNQWCRDGKPALVARSGAVVSASNHGAVTKSKVADMVRAAIDQERANTQASLEALAAIIGEECGRNERALRAEIEAKLDALRAEIGKGVGSDNILELPDWRSYAAH
jgi:hypothetical protein